MVPSYGISSLCLTCRVRDKEIISKTLKYHHIHLNILPYKRYKLVAYQISFFMKKRHLNNHDFYNGNQCKNCSTIETYASRFCCETIKTCIAFAYERLLRVSRSDKLKIRLLSYKGDFIWLRFKYICVITDRGCLEETKYMRFFADSWYTCWGIDMTF